MPRINRLPFIKPDENLAKIIGSDIIQTNVMMKKLWKYIEAHGLKIPFKDYKVQ
jgi:chromatin remodeling complex protein RSC6